jgi:hypothetical protein
MTKQIINFFILHFFKKNKTEATPKIVELKG